MKLTRTHLLELSSVTPKNILTRLEQLHRHKTANKDGLLPIPTLELATAIYERLIYWKQQLAAVLKIHRNIRLLPLHHIAKGACSCGNMGCHSPGKHPRIAYWQGITGGSVDVYAIAGWMYRYGVKMNIGVKTGTLERGTVQELTDERTGRIYHKAGGYIHLYVLDLDSSDAERHRAWLASLGQSTFIVRTQKGGLHAYFKTTKSLKNSVKAIALDLDARGSKGLVVAPGSSGLQGTYEADTQNTWFSTEVPYLAQETIDRWATMARPPRPMATTSSTGTVAPTSSLSTTTHVTNTPATPLTNEQQRWANTTASQVTAMHEGVKTFVIPEGVRNTVALRVGVFLRACRAFSQDQIADYLKDLRLHRFASPGTYSDKEIENIAAWCIANTKPNYPTGSTTRHTKRRNYINPMDSDEFFCKLTKSNDHLVPLSMVAEAYQRFLESRGYYYRRKININAVADHLRIHENKFTRERKRLKDESGKTGKPLNYWNVSLPSIPLPSSFPPIIEGTEEAHRDMNQDCPGPSSTSSLPLPPLPSIIEGTEDMHPDHSELSLPSSPPPLPSIIEGTERKEEEVVDPSKAGRGPSWEAREARLREVREQVLRDYITQSRHPLTEHARRNIPPNERTSNSAENYL